MIINLFDEIVDLLTRMRQYQSSQWWLRGIMMLSGLIAMVPLWGLFPAWPLLVVVGATLLLSLMLPRGHVVTAWCVLILVWSVAAGPSAPWWYVPVALGCVGVHWSAGACTLSPRIATVQPGVWRAASQPIKYAVAGTLLSAALATAISQLALPGSLVLVALSVMILVAGSAVVLWPRERTR